MYQKDDSPTDSLAKRFNNGDESVIKLFDPCKDMQLQFPDGVVINSLPRFVELGTKD